MASNDDSNNLDIFNERQNSAMLSAAQNGGCAGLCRYINANRNAWQDIQTNIAVTGKTGSGKSSFVNAFLRQRASDPGSARPGITQTTVIPTPYHNPSYEKFTVWDLPGVGSPEFPRATYLEKVKYKKYDVFIIIGSDRFTEDDTWLVKEAKNSGIRTYFVRTKVHQDLQNEKFNYPEIFNAERALQHIRENCMEYLRDFDNVQLFLIDNHHVNTYDFDMLRGTIDADQNNLGKEAFARLFESVAKQHLETKRDTLKAGIWKMAVLSGAAGAIPYGLGILADIPVYKFKMAKYEKCFGLDNELLQEIANIRNMSTANLLGIVPVKFATITTVKLLLEYVSKNAFQTRITEYAARTAASTAPVVGTAISVGMSYGMTSFALNTYLDMLYKDAVELMKFVSESLKENS